MRRIHLAAVIGGVAATLVLAGCGGGTSPQAVPQNPPSSSAQSDVEAPSSAADDSSSQASASSSAGSSSKMITVSQSVTDPVMGDHVVVQGLVRDFPFPASMSAVSDGELVLVKVTATAGTKYYAGWQTSGLDVVTPDGTENPPSDTDELDAAMAKAGYTPFPEDGDIDTGKTGTGWVPFVLGTKDSPTLTLRMKRLAATSSDGGTISAQNFDVPLAK
jgi:hypothetical protein